MENIHCLKAPEDLFIKTKNLCRRNDQVLLLKKKNLNLRQNAVKAADRFGSCLCVPHSSAKAARNAKKVSFGGLNSEETHGE